MEATAGLVPPSVLTHPLNDSLLHGARAVRRDCEATQRRRSEDPPRPRSRRSPLGVAQFSNGREKEHKRAQRLTDEESKREAARAATLLSKRALSPIITPDLNALLIVADADRTMRGLPAHTLESFLHHMHEQATIP